MTLKPAVVKGNWAGDYTVLEPGRFEGKEIIKPCLIYTLDEVKEIAERIADQSGQESTGIIKIVESKPIRETE